MKIVDPIAIKEILENGVEIPLTITNMKSPNLIIQKFKGNQKTRVDIH